MIPIVRLFNPKGPDHVAVVSTQAAWAKPGFWNVQVARGPRRAKLSAGTTYGPYSDHEVVARHAQVLTGLRSEGFVRAGLTAMLQALVSNVPKTRAHAAARLGWYADTTAVPAILLAADAQGTDLPSLVDALGRIRDPRGLTLARAEASRKLLSRRRSGVEALRNLGDAAGLREAVDTAVQRLPDAMRYTLNACSPDDASDAAVQLVTQHIKSLDAKDIGLALDTLYEIGSPLSVAASLHGLANVNLAAPYVWRYVKSIFKRTMLRGDFKSFAYVYHRIERVARKAHGTVATVKSGLDGQQRSMRIFQKGTQDFVRRLAWRYLTRLARHRPEDYPFAAAEALAAYEPADAQPVRGAYDEWARAYLFHRVMRGASKRWEFMARALAFRVRAVKKGHAPQPEARTEMFPELWDARPAAYLTLLVRSKVAAVLAFGAHGVAQHPEVLHQASHRDVLSMLGAPHDAVVALATAELERRFVPDAPDWTLIDALVSDTRPLVRALGQKFLTLTAHLWTTDVDRVMAYLGAPDAGLRTVAAGLVVAGLDDADTWMRRELAERVLAVLQTPEPTPGAHEGYARVARDGLAAELASVLSVDELMSMVSKGSPAAQAVGATVLGHKPEAVATLGLPRIVTMAMHDVAAVRSSAHALLTSALDGLRADPSSLFILCESEWADTRGFAFHTLRSLDLSELGIDGYVGLCDSNRDDVQSFGRQMVLRDLPSLDVTDLINRLSQHPAPRVRRFALDLVVGHLREGFVPLAKLENFFRCALFDLWPSRNEKRLVVDFLLQRGLKDERQAEVSSRVLGDFVRVKGRRDFESAIDALVRIKLAYPDVESRVAPSAGGAP